MGRKTGVILSYVMVIFEVLSTLLLTPFIISTLGQAEYGVYKLSAAVVAYLLLLDLGIGNAVIKYSAQFRVKNETEQARKFLGVSTIYYLIIAAVVLVSGAVLVVAFPSAFAKGLSVEEIKLGQQLLGITVINVAFTLGTSAYNNVILAYEKFHVSKGLSIVQIVLRVALTVFFLKQGWGSLGIVIANLIMTVAFRAASVLYVLLGIKLKPLFKGIRLDFIKEIIGYSTWIFLQMVATQINAFVDQVLIGILVPTSAVIIAVYGIGSQVIQYYQTIGSSFNGVLMPGVVKMVESNADSDRLCNEMIRIGRMVFAVLSLIFVCFSVYGKQFISLWVGQENLEAFYVALILMPAHLFILTEAIGTQILWARNEHKEQAILKFVTVILNIFLTILLIRWKPLLGATIGTFISLVLGDIVVMNIVFKKKIKISLSKYYTGLFRGILPSLLITFACGFAFSFVNLSGWVGFACNVALMVAVYVACLLLFGFNRYEKDLARSVLKKVLRIKNT